MTRLALAVAVGLISASLGEAQSRDSASQEAVIKAQLNAYAAARQAGNGTAQSMFYTEDASTWLAITRRTSIGRAAIAKELELAADPNRVFRFEFERISFLNEDIACVDLQFFGAAPQPNGHAFYIMVKRDNKWLIREGRVFRYAVAAQ